MPTTVGSQVKPCCSRFDLYQQHAGIDLRDMFPADESKYDAAKIANWNWDTYLDAAQKLHKAGFPVGLPMGQSSDAVDWVGALFNSYGVVMVDAKDNIKINSDETRTAHGDDEEAHGGEPAGSLCLGRRRQQSLAHFRQGLGHHEPAERLGGRQARQPEVAANCWTHPMPSGPKGRFVGQLPQFYGLWSFSKNKSGGEGPADLHLAEGIRRRSSCRPRSATTCPPSRACTIFDTWKTVEPPVGTVYGYPPRGDEQTSIAGAPARSEVGAQIYNQAINTVMVAKFTQGNEKLDDVIKWASNELEGTLRA